VSWRRGQTPDARPQAYTVFVGDQETGAGVEKEAIVQLCGPALIWFAVHQARHVSPFAPVPKCIHLEFRLLRSTGRRGLTAVRVSCRTSPRVRCWPLWAAGAPSRGRELDRIPNPLLACQIPAKWSRPVWCEARGRAERLRLSLVDSLASLLPVRWPYPPGRMSGNQRARRIALLPDNGPRRHYTRIANQHAGYSERVQSNPEVVTDDDPLVSAPRSRMGMAMSL
jgi:hypothetical protein